MPWRFHIFDGADQGQTIALPEAGVVIIGNSRKHADIQLHDLYVARVHAEVEVDGARVVVTAHDTPAGTLVNGQKVLQQEIRHGDVVRVGNSHLRLLDTTAEPLEAAPPQEDVPEVEVEFVADMGSATEAASEDAGMEESAPEEEVEVVAAEEPDPTDALSQPESPQSPAHLEDLLGQTLAHFELVEIIGKGQAGMVFQARDLKNDRLVALKVLSPDFPHNDEEMKRFVAVWKVVLPLRHPNLVTMYGAGKTGPFCWLAMELVENASLPESIERLSRKAKIDWHRAYRVAVQIARALACANQHGLIHSNITARNILWQSSDKVAKLSDLGLAPTLEGSNLRKIVLRDKLQAELVYLSPEQTQPGCFIDNVCDIYSLGVVVYALLTGRFPVTASTQAELVRKIREVVPARPTKLQPAIPGRLEGIVLKMLAKRQEDRYQSHEDLLADLQVLGEEQDVVV